MNAPTIVLDTNVLVSGLLNPHGAPGRVVDLVIAGEVRVAYDDQLVAEYREVLIRPKFSFDPRDVREVLRGLTADGVPVTARPVAATLPDPDDLPFLEVALAARAEALVTGNLRHFPTRSRPRGLRVEAATDFLRRVRILPDASPFQEPAVSESTPGLSTARGRSWLRTKE